ncbi:putative oxidoreductase [Mycobacterium tuberculosis RGTB423]|nr:putative oxidoreductase [Mycobacterium tuberculosis RGTB423]
MCLAGLMAELPEGMVVTDPAVTDGYRQDRAFDPSAGKPLAIIRPRRTEEVQTVLRWASANQVPVVTRGAGSGLSGGATALDGGIVLSTEKMRDITVDPVTRTAVCQPGLYNAEVKEAAAEHGLWYPPDPSSFEICSIGGNIATNAGGLCCVKYGVTGDYVLGMQVVLANGTAVRLGGPRLKDVAGLSLTKLFVGSEGTLGVITEVTLRLLPAQNASSIVVASFGSVQAAVDAVLGVTGRLRPAMLEFMDSVAINAVEDTLRMDLDRDAAAMLVAGSDERGRAATEDAAVMAAVFAENGAIDVFSTDDPDEGEAFIAARRFAIPAVESKGGVAARGRRGTAARTGRTGHRDCAHRRGAESDDLGDRPRRGRQYPPVAGVRPRRCRDARARPPRVRRNHGPGRRPGRHDHRRTRRGPVETAVVGRLSRARRPGPQPAHQASAGPPGHPQSRLGDLIRRDVPPSVNRTTRPRRVASPDSQSPIDITDGMS